MLKKTITYTDYNGNERTEDFYFNLTKSELAEAQFSVEGGYKEKLEQIVKSKDQSSIIKAFKELVLKAYGEKSDDGRRFMKSKEISDNFACTEAYDIIFMELATDAEKASEFVNGIMPKIN